MSSKVYVCYDDYGDTTVKIVDSKEKAEKWVKYHKNREWHKDCPGSVFYTENMVE